MTCGELRGSDCPTQVAPTWKHCPTCGGVLGRVDVAPHADLRFVQEAPAAEFVVDYRGQEAIKVEARVVGDAVDRLEVEPRSRTVHAPLSLALRAKSAEPMRVQLEVVSFDGTRDGDAYWVPRPGRRHLVDLEIGVAHGPRLVGEPGTLFFSAGREQRSLRLWNRGDLSADIDSVALPSGYRLSEGLGGRTLEPDAFVEVDVSRSTSSQSGPIRFQGKDGPLLEVPIVEFQAPPPRIRTRYVVAVDFGTSNTTVGIRDTRDDKIDQLPDPNSPTRSTRFPTVVLLRGPDSISWAYGETALDQYDPNRHLIVHELKNYLRTDREPFAKRWPACTIDAILAWYLRRLKTDIIEPSLEQLSPDAAPDVHFVFCLPVLDNGPQYELQRSRMERAIRAAGYEDLGEVSYQYEPVCAALYFLQGTKTGATFHDFEEGDRILVFDSGGGTTDIALFTAREVDGQFEPEDVRQVGSHRREGSTEYNQFGGTTLTQYIGFYKDVDSPMLPFANEYDARDYATFDESLELVSGKGFLSIVPADAPDGGESLKWHRRFPRTYRLVEEAKRRVASMPSENNGEVLVPSSYGAEVILERVEIDKIVDVELLKILKSMIGQLGSNEATTIRHVFAVGGNSNIPRVQYHLKELFSNRQFASISPEERMRAVPVGALFAYDPRIERPDYTLEIVDESGKLLVDCGALYQMRGATAQKQVLLGPRQSFVLRVRAKWSGNVEPIAEVVLPNPSSKQTFADWKVRLEDNQVIVDSTSTGQWEELWRYEF